jgi:hypothetical protein
MNTKKFIEIGNIFEFAEARLQKKVSRGDMEYYTALDVIDNAIKIRKYLDKNIDKDQEKYNIKYIGNNTRKIKKYIDKNLKRIGVIGIQQYLNKNELKLNKSLNSSSKGLKIPAQTK